MRDLVLALAIAAICLGALRRPWIGALGWTWISLMNAHALSWKLSNMPVAAAVAGCTLLGLIFARERKDFSLTPGTVILIFFMIWMCITLPFSFSVEDSFDMWKRVMKIDFMVLVSLVLLYSKRHLLLFTWVVVGSIAFYGTKGGFFTLVTGGSYLVWGPVGTYIEGNNELALAVIIVLPLFRFLQLQTASKWGKRAITVAMALCVVSALGSHSRGALLAIVAMSSALWWYGGRKFSVLIGIVFAVVFTLMFMPEQWFERMNTISDYQNDGSAMGRINAWWMAWNLAKANFFGGGYEIYNRTIFEMYAPVGHDVHAAHSIYFQVLGEHGFIGLLLFLLLWLVVWREAGRLKARGKERAETRWVSDLGAMCQVSIIGYAVGGSFLSLAYFDLPYNIMIIVVLAKRWLDRKAWQTEPEEPLLFARSKAARATVS